MILFSLLFSLINCEIVVDGDFKYDNNEVTGHALLECTSLYTEVTIPAHIASIHTRAFVNCASIRVKFELGSLLFDVQENAFLDSAIENITFPPSYIEVNHHLLNKCQNIKYLSFEGRLLNFPNDTFQALPKLEEFKIHGKSLIKDEVLSFNGFPYTYIGSHLFNETKFKEIILPPTIWDSIQLHLGNHEFLETLYIGRRFTRFPVGFLSGATKLKKFVNAEITVYENQILDISHYENLNFVIESSLEGVPIHTLVTKLNFTHIGDVFEYHKELETVLIRSNVPHPFHIPREIRGIPNLKSVNFNSVHVLTNNAFDFSNVQITHFEPFAFSRMQITRIVLPDDGTSLSRSLFLDCSQLQEVIIPFQIELIPDGCFSGCSSLNRLVIFGEELFRHTALDLSGNVISRFGDNAFYSVSTIHSLILDGKDFHFGANSFGSNLNLTSIDFVQIPKSFNIGSSSPFTGSPISTIILPNNTLCTEVLHLEIKQIFPDIDYNWAEIGCISPELKSQFPNHEYYNYDKIYVNHLIQCTVPSGKATIPYITTFIYSYAFNQSGATELEFESPVEIQKIQDNAFAGSKLQKIKIPSSYSQPNFGLFQNLTSLVSVEFESDIERIPKYLFQGSSRLESVRIGSHQILQNQKLNLSIPIRIGEDSFKGVEFSEVIFSKEIPEIEVQRFGFRQNSKLKKVTFQTEIHIFWNYLFEDCISLETIIIQEKKLLHNAKLNFSDFPSFLLGRSVFDNVNIEEVILSEIDFFAHDSFLGSTNLVYLNYTHPPNGFLNPFGVPASIRNGPVFSFLEIGGHVIEVLGKIDLTKIPLITELDYFAFAHIRQIHTAIIPETIKSLSFGIFEDCLELKHVHIKHLIDDIPDRSFRGCSKLITLTIGGYDILKNSVLDLGRLKRIGRYAFSSIDSIKDVLFPSSPLELLDGSFSSLNLDNVIFSSSPTLFKVENASLPFLNSKINDISFAFQTTCSHLEVFPFPRFFGSSSLSEKSWEDFNCEKNPDFTYADSHYRILQSCSSKSDSIVIPLRVFEIRAFAFKNSLVKNVYFEPGSFLIFIDHEAFKDSQVESLELPQTLVELPNDFLRGLKTLKTIKIDSWVRHFPNGSFAGCQKLEKLTIDSVDVFKDKVLNFSGSSILSISSGFFEGVNVEKIDISDQILNLPTSVCQNWETLQSVHLPEHITIIPPFGFSGNIGLTEIKQKHHNIFSQYVLNFSDSNIFEVGEAAFSHVTQILEIVFPSREFKIGVHSFSDLPKLERVDFQLLSPLFQFDPFPFDGDNNLLSLTIDPKSTFPSHLDFDQLFFGSGLSGKSWTDFIVHVSVPETPHLSNGEGINASSSEDINASLFDDGENNAQEGLSAGAVAGIVIGVIVTIGVIGGLIYYFIIYKKKNQQGGEYEMVEVH